MKGSLHYIAQAGPMFLSEKPILSNYLKDHLLYGVVRIKYRTFAICRMFTLSIIKIKMLNTCSFKMHVIYHLHNVLLVYKTSAL